MVVGWKCDCDETMKTNLKSHIEDPCVSSWFPCLSRHGGFLMAEGYAVFP